jgi:DNA polymerase elongation subunit (family B)
LSKAKKAYFGITKDGHPDLKGLTAIKSNAPKFIQNVFSECVKALSNVKNMDQYIAAKKEIINIVRKAIKNLRDRKVTLEDLTYTVRLYHDPNERASTRKSMPQPYQCALQLIDAGEPVRRHDTVHYIKVTPFPYKGKIFTVKPVSHVKNIVEINAEDYIRNLTTALEQTFEPMEIRLDEDMKLALWF